MCIHGTVLIIDIATKETGVLGNWGDGLFIFMELGSTGNYFRGAGEQAHSFEDLESPVKK